MASLLHRRAQPYRVVGTQVVVPRPSDGEPLVLSGSAGTVWLMLDRPLARRELLERLHHLHPDESEHDLESAVDRAIELLVEGGLVEPVRG